jgi:DNA replication protein DnaC
MTASIDAARLTLLLNDLRLPAIKQDWSAFAERADKEAWPAARFLAMLAEHEIAERHRRRLARHLAEAQLLPGKTLDSFDFDVVPMISKAHVMAICAGDSWIGQGANLLLIGGPGGGKTHLASAIGLALVENGWRVLFARTSDLDPSRSIRADPDVPGIRHLLIGWSAARRPRLPPAAPGGGA